MQKLTVLTAAIAAGVMTFAISAANGAPLSQRADQGFIRRTRQDRPAESGSGSKSQEDSHCEGAKRQLR